MGSFHRIFLILSIFTGLSGLVLPELTFQLTSFFVSACSYAFYVGKERNNMEQTLEEIQTTLGDSIESYHVAMDKLIQENHLQHLKSAHDIQQLMLCSGEQSKKIGTILQGHVQLFHESAALHWEETLKLYEEFLYAEKSMAENLNSTLHFTDKIYLFTQTLEDVVKSSSEDNDSILEKMTKSNSFLEAILENLPLLATKISEKEQPKNEGFSQKVRETQGENTELNKYLQVLTENQQQIASSLGNSNKQIQNLEKTLAAQTEQQEKASSQQKETLDMIKILCEEQLFCLKKHGLDFDSLLATKQLEITALSDQASHLEQLSHFSPFEDQDFWNTLTVCNQTQQKQVMESTKLLQTSLAEQTLLLESIATLCQEQKNRFDVLNVTTQKQLSLLSSKQEENSEKT